MAGTEMVTRIIKLYEKLKMGHWIQKPSFCLEHGISERTFDRDIEKVRTLLSEEYSGYEVVYDPQKERYLIPGVKETGELSVLEFALIVKILKGESILEKNEFAGLIHSLETVAEGRKGEKIRAIAQKEYAEYEEKGECIAFLKLFGDLQECITDRNIIRIKLRQSDDDSNVVKFCPIALEYSDSAFFLFGYSPDDTEYLMLFELDEIESFQITLQKFGEELEQKYDYHDGKKLIEKYTKRGGN